jgi:hypothetical protein
MEVWLVCSIHNGEVSALDIKNGHIIIIIIIITLLICQLIWF